MRITRLELRNFRTFAHALFENIPDLVVLVSPNGRGKSSILEAIAGAHDLVRPYHQDNYQFQEIWQQRHLPVWPSHLAPPMKIGEHRAEISLEVQATGTEEAYLLASKVTGTTGKASFVIEDGHRVTSQSANDTIKRLFPYHNPREGVGFLDYIRPTRFYLKHKLGDFARELADDHTRLAFAEFHQPENQHTKFSSFKSFVVSSQLDDFSHYQLTHEERDSLRDFREVFDHFFAPKKFAGYRATSGSEPQVVVDSPYGSHDTDCLSDGEKEILHIMAHLYRFRHLANIILWDTPELHLNAALESRLYTALQRIAPRNQWWIATHSLEFIDAVPLENVFVIQDDGKSARVERVNSADRKARVAIYQDMGARVGLQLVSSVVAFVEGKDAHSDKRILDRLVAKTVPGVNFVPGESCENVLSAGTKANALLEEACANGDFLAIVDRDYRDDTMVEETEKQYKGRVFVWRVHEIENLFLDKHVIYKTLKFHDCLGVAESIKTVEDIRQALTEAVVAQREWIAADWVAWEFDKSFRPPSRRIAGADPQRSLSEYTARLRSKIEEMADPKNVDQLFQARLLEVDRLIQGGKWADRLPGKQILRKFLERFSTAGMNVELFVRTATSAVRENGIEIPEAGAVEAHDSPASKSISC